MKLFAATDTKSTYDRSHEPIGTVEPGETFIVETIDCFGGKFVVDADYSPEAIQWVTNNLNPLTGPVEVAQATIGDVVSITIDSVEITGDARFVRSRYTAHSPQDWWHEEFGVLSCPIADGAVWVTESIRVPVAPIVGCLAAAPAREVDASTKQGTYGGNMDCNLIGPGATLDLRVNVAGAKLYFGDVKAAMGDGEVVNAAEASSRITASVSVDRCPKEMTWPRVRTADTWAVVVSDASLAQAGRIAFKELAAWVESVSNAPREEVIRVLGLASHLGVCQVSNPLHTAHCLIPTSVLEPLLR